MVEESRSGSADTAFIWAFHTSSAADYHRHVPMSTLDVQSRGGEPAPPRAESWELEHLSDWAGKVSHSWKAALTQGGPADPARFIRRSLRLRGGVLDLLPRTAPGQVREVLTSRGVTRDMVPTDLADAVGLPPSRRACPDPPGCRGPMPRFPGRSVAVGVGTDRDAEPRWRRVPPSPPGRRVVVDLSTDRRGGSGAVGTDDAVGRPHPEGGPRVVRRVCPRGGAGRPGRGSGRRVGPRPR